MPIGMNDILELSRYTRDGVNKKLAKPDALICKVPPAEKGLAREFPPDVAMEFGFRGNLSGLGLYEFQIDALVAEWLELWRDGELPSYWAMNQNRKADGLLLGHGDISIEELMHTEADDIAGGFVGAPETHTEHKPATRIAVINLGEIARRVETLSQQE